VRVALVTSDRFPENEWRDDDSPEVARRLERRGVVAHIIPWDGGKPMPWHRYDALVLQSPWSMWRKLAEFRGWLGERVGEGAHVLNPAGVVSAGLGKRYLARLAGLGVQIVPTVFVEDAGAWTADRLRGELSAVFPDAASPRRSIVVKPESSGGALGAREFSVDEVGRAGAYVRSLNGTGMTALVQPYVHAIDTHRELGVITMGDDISHAITKAAILRPDGGRHAFHPDPRPYSELTGPRLAAVSRAYDSFVGMLPAGTPAPLSVRLDFVLDPGADAGLLLLEIEAVAPVKFFSLFPAACEAYAKLIVDRTEARLRSAPRP
jgi:hypothetical protein